MPRRKEFVSDRDGQRQFKKKHDFLTTNAKDNLQECKLQVLHMIS